MRDFANQYLDILTGELAGLNLTRILSPDEFWEKQIRDSLIPLEIVEPFRRSLDERKRLLDIGFGGGFPILPLAKAMPNLSCLGIEARSKKVEAVKRIADSLSLPNVQLQHLRIDDVNVDIPLVSTLKAVGKVVEFLNKFICIEGTEVFFYKGPRFHEEEPGTLSSLKGRWELIGEWDYRLNSGEERKFLGFRSLKANVPRGTHNSLVRVSRFL